MRIFFQRTKCKLSIPQIAFQPSNHHLSFKYLAIDAYLLHQAIELPFIYCGVKVSSLVKPNGFHNQLFRHSSHNQCKKWGHVRLQNGRDLISYLSSLLFMTTYIKKESTYQLTPNMSNQEHTRSIIKFLFLDIHFQPFQLPA